MEDSGIDWTDLLKFGVPFLVAWNVWIHKMITGLDKAIAINETRDAEVIKRLDQWDQRFQDLTKSIEELKVELATRRK